MHSEKKQLPN